MKRAGKANGTQAPHTLWGEIRMQAAGRGCGFPPISSNMSLVLVGSVFVFGLVYRPPQSTTAAPSPELLHATPPPLSSWAFEPDLLHFIYLKIQSQEIRINQHVFR